MLWGGGYNLVIHRANGSDLNGVFVAAWSCGLTVVSKQTHHLEAPACPTDGEGAVVIDI